MKLTEEEKRLVLEKRKKEEIKLTKKIGYLKEDLYHFSLDDLQLELYYLVTQEQKEDIIKYFSNNFELVAKKGDPFDCYIEEDGRESWYDREWGIGGMSAEWANNFLENISNVPKRRTKKCRMLSL